MTSKNEIPPSIYIGHGSPTTVLERRQYYKDLQKFSGKNKEISSIVVFSAHWQQHLPIQITSGALPGVIYDFYGFPQEMYELSYNSPGNPVLAQQIATELQNKNINSILNNNQGLDHGAWVPLKIMFPEEIIPVIQISIPVPRDSYYLFKLGKILSKFRSKNILFMGSGNLVHNIPYAMRQVQFGKIDLFSENNPIENWARETDEWLKLNLDEKNVDSLLRSSEIAPNFKLAAPSTEHFDPLYFILGTMNDSESISYIHEGFQAGSFSMRSFSISNS